MKNYARIENGTVMELLETDGDISTMFHPDLIWVECPPDAAQGDTYRDGKFSRPEVKA